jgi:hypothetical protein
VAAQAFGMSAQQWVQGIRFDFLTASQIFVEKSHAT